MTLLIIHEIGHSVLYFLLAILAFHILKKKKFPWFEVFFGYLVTIGLDADHLIDYFSYYGFSQFRIIEFLEGNYFSLSGKIYIFFHAWEWVGLLLAFYFYTKKRFSIIVFVAVGVTAQLIFDTFSYGFDPRVYFITYRVIHNFSQHIFVPVLY